MEQEGRCALVLGSLACAHVSSRDSLLPWRVVEASNLAAAEALLAHDTSLRVGIWPFDEACIDEHLAHFPELRSKHRLVQWIAVAPPGVLTEQRIARHVAENFFDFLTTPVERDRLLAWLGHAFGMSTLLERAIVTPDASSDSEQMVGSSEAMRQLFRDIRKVAHSDAPVFISGESGTGKELTARAIHERSSRARRSFVAVDCAAIAPTLIHSELFGYEKGAFTGAVQRKIGRIEVAEGGTLFIDEIGDLPLDLQGSLLRFMQESTIQRVGGTRPIPVNVRVIAATHVDLDQAVKQGRFREDLYYRLNVLHLHVPPLRERGDDVELLARYYLNQFADSNKRKIHGFTPQALQVIRQHNWPGNIRELVNRVRRAIVMCDGDWITPEDLDLATLAAETRRKIDLEVVRENAERTAIYEAIRLCSNNYSAAARMLGVSRPTLYRLLDKHRPGSSSLN
jgi:DNA-binding NtrC family response regulator